MKILVAEDDTVSRLVLGTTLKRLGHTVTMVEDGYQAWAAWQQDEYPLVISDWLMPRIEGLELCRMIRAESTLQYTYIILLTALNSRSSYLEGMDAGADDFLTKPFDEDQLAARLRVAERILELHHRLYIQATRDYLTGVWNRATILNFLESELQRAGRRNTSTGVLIVDLDHFKRINDTYGHAAGDEVLQQSARCMQLAVRTYDRIGRYGGEEFLIIVPECDWNQIMGLAQRICDSISTRPTTTQSGEVAMTASLGVAAGNAQDDDSSVLIKAADQALYRAKEKGRNRVEASDRQG